MQNKNSQSDQIHLKDYLAIIRKRKWVVIIFSAVLIGLVTAYSFRATPIYEATAQIIIESQAYPVTRAEQDLNMDIRENDYYQTQYNLLQSRSLALKVIQELGLWKEFTPAQPSKAGGKTPNVKSAVNGLLPNIGQKPLSKPALVQATAASFTDWGDVVNWYLSKLKVDPVKGTRLINISFRSTSPETAARVANAHAKAFIEWTTEMKMAASQQKLNWMKQQPQAPDNKAPSSLPGSPSNKAENIFSLPEVAQDPVILNLRNQLITLKAKRLELASNFGLKHPKMIELNAQITQVEKEIADEAQRVSMVVSSSFETSNISVVDKAEVPLDPVKPRKAPNILLSIIISMVGGPFLAFFIEYMDRTVKTTADAARRLGMPVLGAIPLYRTSKRRNNGLLSWENNRRSKKGRYYYEGDMAVRYIPSLLAIAKQPRGNVLFISSATSGEGKTTVLANSAISLAHRGIRVLVIDTDVFNPALHKAFGVKKDSGMASLLTRVQAKPVRAGDLIDFSIDDLFFLIALQRLTGGLTVTNDEQTITVQFEDGRLLNLLSETGPSDHRLASMLKRGEHMTFDQLKEASEWQKRTGQPLGYILVNGGFITREILHGLIKLQMEELLHRLFSWKRGRFTFERSKTALVNQDEKIYFEDDYSDYIQRLGRANGSRFIEHELLSCIVEVKDPHLWVLPVGSTETKPNIGPASQMIFAKCLEVLKLRYDVIFVDAPPILDMPDSAPLTQEGDGVMFVAKAGKLPEKTILQATARLRESGANILGVVLNQARFEKKQY